MLVLMRHIDEVIVIGENADIFIQILKISGNQVRIGITANKNIPVHRQEIYERICLQNTSDNEKI